MALSQQRRLAQRQSWLRGGGLFVAISLGLHWVVLQMPLPESPEPDLRVTLESSPEPMADPTATMDVVRLPLPAPTATPTTPPTNPSPSPSLSLAPQPPLLAQTPRAIPRPQVPPVVTTPSPETMVLEPQAPTVEPQVPAATQPPEETQSPEATQAPAVSQEPSTPPLPVTEPAEPAAPAGFQYNGQAKAVETSEIGISLWYYDQPWSLDYPLHPTELPSLTVTYTETACLSPAPASGLLVVFLNPDGSFTEPGGTIGANPLLVSSTGYDELDERALTAAQTYDATDFMNPDVQIPKGYALEVEVEYNSQTCTP
jgi:hypothetical protein